MILIFLSQLKSCGVHHIEGKNNKKTMNVEGTGMDENCIGTIGIIGCLCRTSVEVLSASPRCLIVSASRWRFETMGQFLHTLGHRHRELTPVQSTVKQNK